MVQIIMDIFKNKINIDMIQKSKPYRHWNQISYVRKETEQSLLDESYEHSVQSNNSIRFSKFKFKKQSSKSKINKPHSLLTSKILLNKHIDQNHRIPNLFQLKNQSQKSKVLRTDSKLSNEELYIKTQRIQQMKCLDPTDRKIKIKQLQLKRITAQVKYMIGQLKLTIQMFNTKYVELHNQWQKSFKKLLSKYVNIDNTQISKNIQYFQEKIEEIQIMKKPIETNIQLYQVASYQEFNSNIKIGQFSNSKIGNQQSLHNLNISKISPVKQTPKQLSRNDTITSILAHGNNKQRILEKDAVTPKKIYVDGGGFGNEGNANVVLKMKEKQFQNETVSPQRNKSFTGMSNLNNAIKRMKNILQR